MSIAAPLGSMLGSLAVILLLLAGTAFLAKKLRGRSWTPGGNQPIRIVASRSIGWQSNLLVVEVQGQQFLVGSSRAGISGIATLGGGASPSLEA